MKMKKLLLSLGSVAAIATPVAAVVACSSNESTAIYTQLLSVPGANLESNAPASYYIISLGNSVHISNGTKSFLVPSSYVKITPEVPQIYDPFGNEYKGKTDIEGNEIDQHAPATAVLTDLAKKDKALASFGAITKFKTSLDKGELIVLHGASIASVGNQAAAADTLTTNATEFANALGKAKTYQEDKVIWQKDSTSTEYFFGFEGVIPAKGMSEAQAKKLLKDQEDAKKFPANKEVIYMTMKAAGALKVAYNKNPENTEIADTVITVNDIMQFINKKSISDFYDSIAKAI